MHLNVPPACSPYVPRIPANISQWAPLYMDNANPPVWEPEHFVGAGVKNYEQLRPLLTKLQQGLPITVVAYGSST